MTEPQEETAVVDDSPRKGLIERLRRRREAIGREDATIDLDVPGYGGDLFVRYGKFPGGWDVLKKLGERVAKSRNPRAELNAAADTLVHSCQGIYCRQEDGTVEPLDDANAEEAPVFGDVDRVGLTLGFATRDHKQNPITARQCVFKVFNNDLAVQAQYIELSQWLQDMATEDDEEFVGESQGSTR